MSSILLFQDEKPSMNRGSNGENCNNNKKKKRNVYIVKPDWIIQCKSIFDKPTLDQIWSGSKQLYESTNQNKRKNIDPQLQNNEWIKRKRKIDEFAPITKVLASKSTNEMVARLHHNIQNHKNDANGKDMWMDPTSNTITDHNNLGKNAELSQLFDKISKLYKDMPLDNYDEWRSYSYNMAAARLRYLNFQVCNNEESLMRLSQVKGFGKKFMKHIREYLITGGCELIRNFERDPSRVNVRNMIKIWGIGPKKAVELVKLGYTDIQSVREALELQKLDLHENARIGVQFYEEFQEKMDREEAKKIGEIVAEACRKYFQDAEITTMGSFRRGSEKCGDVDVLITHPKFIRCTPIGALDELVERLRDGGYISRHLTPVDPTHKSTLPLRANNMDDFLLYSSKKSQSYMGVFVSPSYKNKHRRIDIKFYPYREKAFATLYFTGNGYFNRAMRLYAKVQKGMKLDDHGLFTKPFNKEKAGHRVKVLSEKAVFDILGLIYKEPHERDSFEAVVKNEGSLSMDFDLNNLRQSEIEIESRNRWIE